MLFLCKFFKNMMIYPFCKRFSHLQGILFWPLWQWPRLWQWTLALSVVLAFACMGWAWWWHQSQSGQESERLLASAQALSQAEPTAAAATPDGQSPGSAQGGLAAPALGDLSAGLLAQTELAGLKVASWTVTPEAATTGQVRRAGISMQLQGPYSAVKPWLAAVLRAQPQMVVDKMQWRAADVGGAVLDVQISWSVYGPQ